MKRFDIGKVVMICFVAILGGCSLTGSGAKKYDGIWSGLITLTIGDETCMRRENFVVEVEDGDFIGKTRRVKYKTRITGAINDKGEIQAGEFELGTVARNAVMTGVFTEGAATGDWQSKRCKGKWTLRRIR